MTFLSFLYFVILCASAGTFIGTILPYAVRVCVRRGFTDCPDEERKHHRGNIPPIGGVLMVPVFMILMPFLGFSIWDHIALYISLGLLMIMGIADDLGSVAPPIKLGVQILAAAIITISNSAVLSHLGHLFGVDHIVYLSFIAIPFTLVCFIFFMNALNMMDGMDGLGGGLSFTMLGLLALAALMGQDVRLATAAALMMSLLFGFLLHNMRYPGHRRATVFLGDTGSFCLAFLIAWLGIQIVMDPTPGMPPISMAFVIFLPILDAFALFIVRKRAGKSPFTAGRDHLHHLIQDRLGLTPMRITPLLLGATFLLGAFGVFGPLLGLGEGPLTLIWIFSLLGYTGLRLVIRT